jgi:adenylate cyclase
MTKLLQKYYIGLIVIISTGVAAVILSFPFFSKVNTFFSDLLQGETPVREEIIIIGIDDATLQGGRPWPWPRETTADLLTKISQDDPRVIGVDVLFIDSRPGDEILTAAMVNSKTPIVVSAKIQDNILYTTKFKGQNIIPGVVNVTTDIDGKVRTIHERFSSRTGCVESFSKALYTLYRNAQARECSVAQEDTVIPDRPFGVSYSRAPFRVISAKDVLDGTISAGTFKNKVVLVGATTSDIASNLSDTFIDIFGNKIPGVFIHAHSVNTLLQNLSFTYVPYWLVILAVALVGFFLSFVYRTQRTGIAIIVLVLSSISVFIVSIVLYEFGIILPVITIVLLVITQYIVTVVMRYLEVQRKNRVISDSFAKYVNPHILSKIIEEPGLLKLGGDKRNMTVLFSDIRGFTQLSEKMKPEALVDLLNTYLDGMSEVVLSHGGTIDKYIGDAIMAFWNAPVTDEKHALHSILTSLDMIEALKIMNKEMRKHQDLSIGIGINTGDMVIGNVGSKRRFTYTVLGDEVNLASRLEGLTKKYKSSIIVSEQTVKSVGPDLDGKILFRQLDVVQVKGKENPVAIFEPMRYSPENLELSAGYVKALLAYQEKDFEKALEIFSHFENDGPSKVMIERIKSLDKTKEFNGIWAWDEK